VKAITPPPLPLRDGDGAAAGVPPVGSGASVGGTGVDVAEGVAENVARVVVAVGGIGVAVGWSPAQPAIKITSIVKVIVLVQCLNILNLPSSSLN
jgi:hypothetical protein